MEEIKLIGNGIEITELSTISREKGYRIFSHDGVGAITRKNGLSIAFVEGKKTSMSLNYNNRIDSFYCECGSGILCRHCAALYLKLKEEATLKRVDCSFIPVEIKLNTSIHTQMRLEAFTRVDDNSFLDINLYEAKIDEIIDSYINLDTKDCYYNDGLEDLILEGLNIIYNLNLYLDKNENLKAIGDVIIYLIDRLATSLSYNNEILVNSLYDNLLLLICNLIDRDVDFKKRIMEFIIESPYFLVNSRLEALFNNVVIRYLDKASSLKIINKYTIPKVIIGSKEILLFMKALEVSGYTPNEVLNILLNIRNQTLYVMRLVTSIYKYLSDMDGLEIYLKRELKREISNKFDYFLSSKKEELIYARYYLERKNKRNDLALNTLRELFRETDNIEYFYTSLELSSYNEEIEYYSSNGYTRALREIFYIYRDYDGIMDNVNKSKDLNTFLMYEGVLGSRFSDVFIKYYREYILLNLGFSKTRADYRRLADIALHLIYLSAGKKDIEPIINEIVMLYKNKIALLEEFSDLFSYYNRI